MKELFKKLKNMFKSNKEEVPEIKQEVKKDGKQYLPEQQKYSKG